MRTINKLIAITLAFVGFGVDINAQSAPCFNVVTAQYYYICGGNNLSQGVGVKYTYGGRKCGTEAVTITSSGGGSAGGGFSGSGGTGPGTPGGGGGSGVTTSSSVPIITKNEECHECTKEIKRKVLLIKQGGN